MHYFSDAGASENAILCKIGHGILPHTGKSKSSIPPNALCKDCHNIIDFFVLFGSYVRILIFHICGSSNSGRAGLQCTIELY